MPSIWKINRMLEEAAADDRQRRSGNSPRARVFKGNAELAEIEADRRAKRGEPSAEELASATELPPHCVKCPECETIHDESDVCPHCHLRNMERLGGTV